MSRAAERLPSRTDPTVWRASRPIGGPWGRHAGVGRTWWTPLRWLLLMTLVTLALGFAQKAPCTTGDWVGNKQYTHFCYSDVVPLWSDERLDVGAVPYRDTTVEYPVLTGAFMWLTADLTRGIHALETDWSSVVIFGVLTALLLSLCALVVTAATTQTARGRPWDAAIFALSPLLVFHAFSNWDLLAMAFTAAAMWAWAARRPVLSGAMIGLGTAAKLYPVFLLVAIWILAVRTRKFADAAWATLAAGLVWFAVNGPIAIAYHRGWWEFYRFSIDRPTERSTFWAMGRTLWTGSVSDQRRAVLEASRHRGGLGVTGRVARGRRWVGLAAPVRPRLAQLAFLCVLAFLLTTKVWSPQYSMWLVPLHRARPTTLAAHPGMAVRRGPGLDPDVDHPARLRRPGSWNRLRLADARAAGARRLVARPGRAGHPRNVVPVARRRTRRRCRRPRRWGVRRRPDEDWRGGDDEQ